MLTSEQKSRENRLRRKAARQGLTLTRSSRRAPDARDYGRYSLTKTVSGQRVSPLLDGQFAHAWTLDDVEAHLTKEPKP
jgi:hypothetical protein